MGLFDRIAQKKEEQKAKEAQQAREKEEMINRLKQNHIFIDYATLLHNYLSDPACEDLRWACGNSEDQRDRCLALVSTSSQFGLIRYYLYWVDAYGTILPKSGMEAVDIKNFSNLGMQDLPSGWDYCDAVLDTISSQLKDLPFLSLSEKKVLTIDIPNKGELYLRAINMKVNSQALNAQLKGW